MGFSLQNHLAALFDAQKIRYEAQPLTENKNRPDFLFPGGREYRDQRFDSSLLVMLGAKSTLKERWRQILVEANRIPHKHLCTLQPGISAAQTQQINDANVHLSAYEDVKKHAEAIYSRLDDGSMPCDEPWPKAQIAKFKQWMDDGMAP